MIIRIGGRGIYRDAILEAAPYGLISIHHGDNRLYRGGPPGFWEVLDQAIECGFIVQRLTRTLDGGEVLARGSVPNSGSAVSNKQALYLAADQALGEVVKNVLKHRVLPSIEPRLERLGPIYKLPNLSEMWRYRVARKIWQKYESHFK